MRVVSLRRTFSVLLTAAVFSLGVTRLADAAVLGTYEFTSFSNTVSSPIAGGSFSPFIRSEVSDGNGMFNTSFAASNWRDDGEMAPFGFDDNEFVGFTYTVAPGFAVNFEQIAYFLVGTADVANMGRLTVSVDGGAPVFTQMFTPPSQQVFGNATVNFPDLLLGAGQTISFRWAVAGNVSLNGGTPQPAGLIRLDNVALTGTVIPEPTTMALLALGVAGLTRRRRA